MDARCGTLMTRSNIATSTRFQAVRRTHRGLLLHSGEQAVWTCCSCWLRIFHQSLVRIYLLASIYDPPQSSIICILFQPRACGRLFSVAIEGKEWLYTNQVLYLPYYNCCVVDHASYYLTTKEPESVLLSFLPISRVPLVAGPDLISVFFFCGWLLECP